MYLSEDKQITKGYYDKAAPEWTRTKDDLNYLETEFREFQKLLPRGKVIDIGCGTGRDAGLFKKDGYEYVGVDISTGMLSEARKLFSEADFRQMDLMKLDFPDGYFDGIWSFATYLHIPKAEINDALNEARRVIKIGGIGFIVIKKGSKEGYFDSDYGKRYWSFYGKNQFAKILENNGFEIIKFWEDKRAYKPPKDVTVFLCYLIKKVR